jgi:alkylhydroperoxidase/carboxymuconolactone decarboxylase family protein YurZ
MNRPFATIDIILASYLKVLGFKLQGIEREGNRGTFVFEGVPKHIVEEYDLGKALVEPKALNNEIRSLATAARR